MDTPQPEPRRQRRYQILMVLSYIVDYQREHDGESPTQRQAQRDLEISAPSVVHGIVHRLADRGLLRISTHGRGFAGALTVTAAGHKAVAEWRQRMAEDDKKAAKQK